MPKYTLAERYKLAHKYNRPRWRGVTIRIDTTDIRFRTSNRKFGSFKKKYRGAFRLFLGIHPDCTWNYWSVHKARKNDSLILQQEHKKLKEVFSSLDGIMCDKIIGKYLILV